MNLLDSTCPTTSGAFAADSTRRVDREDVVEATVVVALPNLLAWCRGKLAIPDLRSMVPCCKLQLCRSGRTSATSLAFVDAELSFCRALNRLNELDVVPHQIRR